MKERNKIKSMTTPEAKDYLKKLLKWTAFIRHHRKVKIAIEQILKSLE